MIANDDSGSYLTKEELEQIEQVTEREPDRDLTYAQVFPINALANPNATTHEYFIAEDDEGAAELVSKLESYPMLSVANKRVSYSIYKTKIGFHLPVEDIETSRAWNAPLQTVNVQRALRKVEEKINKIAYIGDESYQVPGILSASGVTSISGTDWSTANLDIANEVISYMMKMPVIYRQRPYSLVLADAEYQKLMNYFNSSSAVGDRNHMERINSALPNLTISSPEVNLDAGTVLYDSGTVAAGTALLIPDDNTLVQMSIAKAPYTLTENKVVDEAVKGAVAARIGIVETPFPTAIGKITGLQG